MQIQSTITIIRPAHKVFAYTLNPVNTPKYVEGITREVATETPAKLDTIYRNQRQDGNWSEYTVTAFKQDELFELTKKDSDLKVAYAFKPLGHYQCELTYTISGDTGSLSEAILQEILERLKTAVEND